MLIKMEGHYPDPDEQFEMMYADELEHMNDLQFDDESLNKPPNNTAPKSSFKRSLNFQNMEDYKTLNSRNSNGGTSNDKSESCQNHSSRPLFTEDSIYFNPVPSTSKALQEHDIIYDEPMPLTSKEFEHNTSYKNHTPSTSTCLEKHTSIYDNVPSTSKASQESCKRTTNDLFGDISDLDNEIERTSNRSKKFKTESDVIDPQCAMIEKIVNKRKEHIQQSRNTNGGFEHISDSMENSTCEVLVRLPNWSFVTIRDRNGDRLYVKFKSEEAVENQVRTAVTNSKHFSMLSTPFEDLYIEAINILESKNKHQLEQENSISNTQKPSDVSDITDLWVQKYKPSSYLELLSDESTNRTLLHWVKLWDKVVFGIERRIRMKPGKENKGKYGDHKFIKKPVLQLNDELDEMGCPQHKIALLCGPPGLGKTTLAHMVARHAGYNVVEINASDDRSPEIFRNQLEAATQMKSVMGACPRPNCLILDEIDGAPQASIEVLVKFSKGKEVASKQKGKRKGSKVSGILKRPVICICNDVYVPALRPLRQIAFVIFFPPTAGSRLAQRLVEISRYENVKTDIGAMMALCEKTNNDIRSCLSTMYCLKDQPIRLATVHKTNIGNKDMQKGLFTVWQDVFQIYPDKIYDTRRIKSDGSKSVSTNIPDDSLLSRRSAYVLKNIQGNGDYEKIMQGVYENYLNMKIKDYSMNNIFKGLQWFCFFDEVKNTINSKQNYSIMPYLPYCFITWHLLLSSYNRPKLMYPNFFYECMIRHSKCQQLVQDVMLDVQPTIRAHTHQSNLLLDTLPLFLYLITPTIRPVSLQLYSKGEKESLDLVINSMIDYNLNFVQVRLQDGSYDFLLDPNIEEVVKFSNFNQTKTLNYGIRQMISREIDLEKVKRIENTLYRNNKTNNDNKPPVPSHDVTNIQPCLTKGEPVKQATPNHLQKLVPKVSKKPQNVTQMKDFFGRVIDNPVSKNKDRSKVDDIVKSDIWFHFKEGFSNAVRRSVYMKDL